MISLEIPVELLLLIIEFILLIATLALLELSRREWHGRERLIEHLIETTRVITRHDYFLTVMDGLRGAKKEVIAAITGTKPREEDTEIVREVINLIKKASSRGVKLRYLIPKARDRLHIGYLYSKAGAEVRYHRGLVVYDLRYMIIDDDIVILGLPERAGKSQPTRKGFRISSESVAKMFKEKFYGLWNSDEVITYESFIKDSIMHLVNANPDISRELIAKHLDVSTEEVSKYLNKLSNEK